MSYLAAAIVVMAVVTYALRVLPLVLVSEEITQRWWLSFLHYVPYAVLTAMTIPAIFSATSHWLSAAGGFIVAVAMAWRGQSLMAVGLSAALAVWLIELAL